MTKNSRDGLVNASIQNPWTYIDIDPRGFKRAIRRKAKDVAKAARRLVNQRRATSSAGDFPARKTGALFRAIRERVSRSGMNASVAPFRNSELGDPYYPGFLLYGAKGRSPGGTLRTRANYVYKALNSEAPDIRRDLEEALQDALRPRPLRIKKR